MNIKIAVLTIFSIVNISADLPLAGEQLIQFLNNRLLPRIATFNVNDVLFDSWENGVSAVVLSASGKELGNLLNELSGISSRVEAIVKEVQQDKDLRAQLASPNLNVFARGTKISQLYDELVAARNRINSNEIDNAIITNPSPTDAKNNVRNLIIFLNAVISEVLKVYFKK